MHNLDKYRLVKLAVDTNYTGLAPAALEAKFREIWERKGGDPESPAISYLMSQIKRHDAKPEYQPESAVLPRSRFRAEALPDKPHLPFVSADDMERMGFVSSYVAVPERGQSQLRTFRHPYTGIHAHRHDKDWLMHRDKWPSLSMEKLRYQQENPGASWWDTQKYTWGEAFPRSLPHIVYEGIPGYINFGYNTLMDNPSFGERLQAIDALKRSGGDIDKLGDKSIRRLLLRDKPLTDLLSRGMTASIGMGAAASAGNALWHKLRGKPRLEAEDWLRPGLTTAGATSGFLGGKILSDKLIPAFTNKGPFGDLTKPGPASMLFSAGLPVLGGLTGYLAGGKLYDTLSPEREDMLADLEEAREERTRLDEEERLERSGEPVPA